MKEKKFNEKKIIIRSLEQKDLKIAKKFQDFINSFVAEDAQIIINKRVSLDEEKKWLKEELRKIKLRHTVFLVAEYKNEIIGTTSINSGRGRQAHVGGFGITIKNGYRRMGLGNYLMGEIIKLAKKELKPRPQIFELEVFPSNRAAINLYKKWGFGEVARIPKTIEYKGNLIDRIIMVLSK